LSLPLFNKKMLRFCPVAIRMPAIVSRFLA
jgi:hypothetical protein